MAEEFKINDVVKIINWNVFFRKNWVIVEFASNGAEAVLRHFYNGSTTIVLLSGLRHQRIVPVMNKEN